MVDCGGDFCDKCFDVPTEAPDTRIYRYYWQYYTLLSNLKYSLIYQLLGAIILIHLFIFSIRTGFCWYSLKLHPLFISDLKYQERIEMTKSTIDVRADIKISKAASDWRFTLFFDKPITKWRTFWNCKLLDVNEYKTVSNPYFILQRLGIYPEGLG